MLPREEDDHVQTTMVSECRGAFLSLAAAAVAQTRCYTEKRVRGTSLRYPRNEPRNIYFVMLFAQLIVTPIAANGGQSEQNLWYTGKISDAHNHLEGSVDTEEVIRALDRSGVDKIVIMVKAPGGWTDDHALKFRARYPDRVVPAIGFQNRGWGKQQPRFIQQVREKATSGQFKWLGEARLRSHETKQIIHPQSGMFREVLELSARNGLPVTIHNNNPLSEAEVEAFRVALAKNPKAIVVWAHWCGLSTPNVARRFLEQFPKLHCDLAWIHKPPAEVVNPLVDDEGHFLSAWKELIEAFPDRFLVGMDGRYETYQNRAHKYREALGRLRSTTARKVATENFHRILPK